jgi:hypothetical protein
MSPEIIIALISSITTIIVAFLQFRKPSKNTNQKSEPKKTWKIIVVIVLLNIVTIVAAISWIYAGLVDIGGGARDYQEMVDEAKKSDKPYILESVVAHVRIADSVVNNVGKRIAEVRITYVIRPLRTITVDEGAFIEEYRLNPAKIPFHWFGTNIEEKGNDISNTYTVNMSGTKGQVITLVTGSTYEYPLPMPDDRVIPDGVTRLASNEDYYMYLNTTDYIANLVVVVESSTTNLATIERGSFQHQANKPAQRKETFFGGRNNSKPKQNSISSKWDNLRPGQSAGIIYSW